MPKGKIVLRRVTRDYRDGLLLTRGSIQRARVETIVLLVALVGIIIVFDHRGTWLKAGDVDVPVRIGTCVLIFLLGWALVRHVWGALGSVLLERTDPSTAVTLAFLIKAATAVAALLLELHIAGINLAAFAVGGAFAAVVFGLAAQQLLGNALAGAVLLTARPFSVGDRVRFQGGAIGGQIEGIVSSFGLLYVTIERGDDSILIPNAVAQNVAVMPLEEADSVNLRARLPRGVTPQDLQAVLSESLTTPLRREPRIILEGIEGDEVIVEIVATPMSASEGAQLATELLEAMERDPRRSVERIEHHTGEHDQS
jgi:small-conductance mechanosensitive channel